ncbi:27157_t:CDS:2, partial [Racocetra persica]
HFSNTGSSSKKNKNEDYKRYSSIEGVHNIVHNKIGGPSGHMAYTETAGFDPIFFLHHANVDRLVAIWQVCKSKKDSWMKKDGKLDENTSLEPFTGWTSKKKLELGYTYPELGIGEDPDPDKLLDKMLKFYQPTPISDRKWTVSISVMKNEVGSPFEIRVFIDLPDNSPIPPVTSPKFTGFISIFAWNSKTNCPSCDANPNVLVNDSVDITACLLRLNLVNEENELDWPPYNKEKPLHKRISLVPVLLDGSPLVMKEVGLKAAHCWDLKIRGRAVEYIKLGQIV